MLCVIGKFGKPRQVPLHASSVAALVAYRRRRRAAHPAMRPQEEYRPATDQEWHEFEEHFDKRKVELGSCGRPYGTSCQREHACLRCAQLHVNPKMLPRLDELESDLTDRRNRATARQPKHG
ncbi:MAG: hypothetical protein ACRDUV_17890 [Pseudonocardiaceae bacterium]